MKWETVTFFPVGRYAYEDKQYDRLPCKGRALGQMVIHSKELEVTSEDRRLFLAPPKGIRNWVVSHKSSGMRISKGPLGRGYTRKKDARMAAEEMSVQFPDFTSAVPSIGEDQVEFLARHPDYKEFVAYVTQMNEDALL